MRTLTALLLASILASCGSDDTPRPAARLSTDPATTPTPPVTPPEVAPEPSVEPPAPAPDPIAAAPAPIEHEEDEEDLPIPTSPPLPEPPSVPTRAHVFEVPEPNDEEDEDFGDEPELTDDDALRGEHLFIPEQALRPVEDVELPVPMGRDTEVEFAIAFPRFELSDPRIDRIVRERVSAFVRSRASARDPGVTCEGIATDKLVSIHCSSFHVSARSRFDEEVGGYSAMTLRIEGGEVHTMALADAFVPGADLDALLARGCERYVEEEELEDDQLDCRASAHLADHAAFGASGIVVGTDSMPTEMVEAASFVVPYDDLAGQLLARGPLAESLYRRRARVREVDVDPSRRAAAPATRGAWAIGEMTSSAEAAMAWLSLPAASRDAIRFVDGYLVAPSQEAARAIAASRAVREVRISPGAAPLSFRAMQIAREAPLRVDARRTAPIARTLPRGTIVVTTGDATEGHARVFATADADGFVESRALAAPDGCIPDLAPVVASLPESARASAALTTLRVLARQPGGARAIFVTELGETVHVELQRVSDECATERVIARLDRPGSTLTYIGLTHTERRAGRALIVTATGGERPEAAVHPYDGGQQLFAFPLDEGQRVAVGRSEGDLWYPVVVLDEAGEQVDAYVWTGETLAHPPPAE